MAQKLAIHFNDETKAQVDEYINLLGWKDVYGAVPKSFKFGITTSLAYFKWLDAVIPDLKPEELDILFATIKKIKVERYKAQEIEKIQNSTEKGIPTN